MRTNASIDSIRSHKIEHRRCIASRIASTYKHIIMSCELVDDIEHGQKADKVDETRTDLASESDSSSYDGEARKSLLGTARTPWHGTALLILTEVMGTGVLSLPHAAVTLGWVAAVLAVVVFGACGAYSGYILGRVKESHKHVKHFHDAALELVGPRFATVTHVGMLLNWGTLAIYFLIAMSNSIEGIYNQGFLGCTVTRTFVSALILLIPTQCRDFDSISKILSIPSVIAVLISILIVTVALMSEGGGPFGNDTTVGPSPGTNPLTFLQALSAFVFAFKSSIFMEVLAEMKAPKQFPKALAYSFTFMAVVYMYVVVTAYGMKGSAVPGFLPDILPEGPARITADVLLLIHITIAYVVVAQPVHAWIHSKVAPKTLYKNTTKGKIHWFLICLGFVSFAWLIANLVPFFDEVQSLIGSLFGAPIMFGWPALFYTLSCRRKTEDGTWKSTLKVMGWKHSTMCALFLFAFLPLFLILGTAGSLMSIIDSIQNAGAPFSC